MSQQNTSLLDHFYLAILFIENTAHEEALKIISIILKSILTLSLPSLNIPHPSGNSDGRFVSYQDQSQLIKTGFSLNMSKSKNSLLVFI